MKIVKFLAILLTSCISLAQGSTFVVDTNTSTPIVVGPEYDALRAEINCTIDSFDVAVSGAVLEIGSGIDVTISNVVINDGPITLRNEGTLTVKKLTIVVDSALISQGGKYEFTVFEDCTFRDLTDVNMNDDAGIECFVTADGEFITPLSSSIEWVLGGDLDLNFGGGAGTYVVRAEFAAAIPEPSTAALSLLALGGLAMRRRRK